MEADLPDGSDTGEHVFDFCRFRLLDCFNQTMGRWYSHMPSLG